MFAVAGTLPSGRVAQAADYVVKIDTDAKSGKDAISLICWFDHTCHGELKALDSRVRCLRGHRGE